MKISLDAGHGLHTPGKRTPDGMREWEFNSVVVAYMCVYLAEYEGVQLLRVDDPTGNADISLDNRIIKARNWGSELHVSVHGNAYGSTWNDANGIETFISSDGLPTSEKLYAQAVQEALVKATGLRDRGVKTANFAMTKVANHIPSILPECGFMTNRKEAALMKTNEYRIKVARAIVDGIAKQAKLKKKEVVKVEQETIKLSPNQQKDKDLLVKHGLMSAAFEVKTGEMVALVTMTAALIRKLEAKGVL